MWYTSKNTLRTEKVPMLFQQRIKNYWRPGASPITRKVLDPLDLRPPLLLLLLLMGVAEVGGGDSGDNGLARLPLSGSLSVPLTRVERRETGRR